MTVESHPSTPHAFKWHKKILHPVIYTHQLSSPVGSSSNLKSLSLYVSQTATLLCVAMQSILCCALLSEQLCMGGGQESLCMAGGQESLCMAGGQESNGSMVSNALLHQGCGISRFLRISISSTSYSLDLLSDSSSIVPLQCSRAFKIPLQVDRAIPHGRLRLALSMRNVFFHEDYAEIKKAKIKTSEIGSITEMHISFFVSKFSPLQRSFDGLCGIVHTLDAGMYLENHPGVPNQLRRLKYFVTGFGSKVMPRDPTSQYTIEVWAFSSFSAAVKKAVVLRKFASAVHTLHRYTPKISLGNVTPIVQNGRRLYRVTFHTFSPFHVYRSFTAGKEEHLDFSTFDKAQRFANKIWRLTNLQALPFIAPSKTTLLNVVRLNPNQRTEQFFSSLQTLTFLAIGTISKTKAERVARIRLDRMFQKETDAWEHARKHRPKENIAVKTLPPLPSTLALSPHRPSYNSLEMLRSGAAPKRILEALGALLPDDPHRTQQSYRRLKQLRGIWREERRVCDLQPWQIEALQLRLHPSWMESFSHGWKLWTRSKAKMKHRMYE